MPRAMKEAETAETTPKKDAMKDLGVEIKDKTAPAAREANTIAIYTMMD